MILSREEQDYIHDVLTQFKNKYVDPRRMYFEISDYNKNHRDVSVLISGHNCDCEILLFDKAFMKKALTGNPEEVAGKVIKEHLNEFDINRAIERQLPFAGEQYGPRPRTGLRQLINEDVEYFNSLIAKIDKLNKK